MPKKTKKKGKKVTPTAVEPTIIPTIAPSPILDPKKVYDNVTEVVLEYKDLIAQTIPSFQKETSELKDKLNIFVFEIDASKEENKKKFLNLKEEVVKLHFKISGLFHTQFAKLEKKIQNFDGQNIQSVRRNVRLLEKEKLENVLPAFNEFIVFVENDVKDFLIRHINDVKSFYTLANSLKSEFTKWLKASVFDPIRDVVYLSYFGDKKGDNFVAINEDPMELEYPDVNFINVKEYIRYYGFVSRTQLLQAKTISFEEFEENYKIKKDVKFSYDRVMDDDKLIEERANAIKIEKGEEVEERKIKRKKTRKNQIRTNELRMKLENLQQLQQGKKDAEDKKDAQDKKDDLLGGAGDSDKGEKDDKKEEKEEKEEEKAELVNELADAEMLVEDLQDEINMHSELKGNIFQKYNHFSFTSQKVAKAITLLTTRSAELMTRVIAEVRRQNLFPNELDLQKLINEKPTYVLRVLTKSYADKKQKEIFQVPSRIYIFFKDWSTAEHQNNDEYASNLPVMIESIDKLVGAPKKATWIDNLVTKKDVSNTILELTHFVKEKSKSFLVNEDIYLFLKFKELKIDLTTREFYYETDKKQKFIYVPTDKRKELIREFNQRPNVRGLGVYKVYLAICDEYIGITEHDVRNALTTVAERKDDYKEVIEHKEEVKDDFVGGDDSSRHEEDKVEDKAEDKAEPKDDKKDDNNNKDDKKSEKKIIKKTDEMKVEDIIDNFYKTRHYQLTKQTYKQINSPVLATSPNFKWALDLIDIGYYELEYKYLLTVIDVFSKRCWIEKMKKKNALEMFYAFLRVLYRASTFPHQIMCDNGGEFQSSLKNFCECDESYKVFIQMKSFTEPNKLTLVEKPFIKVINTLSYSPRSNGLVENLNNTVRKLIRRMVTRHENNQDWIQRKNLLEIENVKNNMKNVSTKFSPDQLWTQQPYLKKDYSELNRLDHVENELQQKARMRLKSRAKRILSINPEFEIGDIVRVKLSTLNSKIRQAIKQGDKKNLNRAFSETLFKINNKIESQSKQRNTMYTLDNALTGERLGRQVFSNTNAVLKANTKANIQNYRRIFGDEMLLVIPQDTTSEKNQMKIIEDVKTKLLSDNHFQETKTKKKGESKQKFTRRLQRSKNKFIKDLDWKVDPKSKTAKNTVEFEEDLNELQDKDKDKEKDKDKNKEDEDKQQKDKDKDKDKEKEKIKDKLEHYEASSTTSSSDNSSS